MNVGVRAETRITWLRGGSDCADECQLAGTHNSSDLNLFWESDSPVTVNRDLHLTEYRLVNMWSNFSVANHSLTADVRTAFGMQSRLYGKFGECPNVPGLSGRSVKPTCSCRRASCSTPLAHVIP